MTKLRLDPDTVNLLCAHGLRSRDCYSDWLHRDAIEFTLRKRAHVSQARESTGVNGVRQQKDKRCQGQPTKNPFRMITVVVDIAPISAT